MHMSSISYVSAGVQMPDVLNFCQGEIKLSWISTELYSKAARLLARHESGKKAYDRASSGEYFNSSHRLCRKNVGVHNLV